MMMPSSIILDPAITKYTPEKLWLGSGTRAMDHGIEAICSSRPNVLVDTVCQQGLRYLHVMPSVLRYNRPATEAAQKSIAARHVPIGSPSALATSATPWL
jgi:maleylacetate reductase